MTVAEVAQFFGVSEYAVRVWARSRNIPATKIGKRWFFHKMQILNDRSMKDAIKILGSDSEYSRNKDYDILLKKDKVNVRVEVKSSKLYSTKSGQYWKFGDLHNYSKQDYYLLLGYDDKCFVLKKIFFIPSLELHNYIKTAKSKGTKPYLQKDPSSSTKRVTIYTDNKFMEGFNINNLNK